MNQPFQTMQEVDDYFSGSTIMCLICGKRFQRLHKHLIVTHETTTDDYRRQFGIPFRRGLSSAPSRAKGSALMTPDRIEQFRQMTLSMPRPANGGLSVKGRVPAVANQWKQNSKSGRYFARTQAIAHCSVCGCELMTTMLVATQSLRCMKCTTPGAEKSRRYYWRQKLAA